MKNYAHANRTMHTLQSPAAALNRGGSKTVFNASVVTLLSVAERGLGFLYRVVLSRLIGAEGLGLYHVALSLFSVFLTIGTGGIPITVSRFISKSKAENNPLGERHALTAGLTVSLFFTLPVCIFFLLFAEKIPFLFSDERSIPLFRILICGLAFSSLYAVLRGYFWGNKQFLLPSVLEIAEEAVMVIVGVLLLKNVLSPTDGATKASFAVLISYLFSFTTAAVCFFCYGRQAVFPSSRLKTVILRRYARYGRARERLADCVRRIHPAPRYAYPRGLFPKRSFANARDCFGYGYAYTVYPVDGNRLARVGARPRAFGRLLP